MVRRTLVDQYQAEYALAKLMREATSGQKYLSRLAQWPVQGLRFLMQCQPAGDDGFATR
jgi:hypothetical protein